MGGTPIGQTGVTQRGLVQQNQNVIGSGVQVAGWNSSNYDAYANQQAFAQSQIGSGRIGSGIGPNPNVDPNYRGPVSSGMRVIDLTGAPNPPGYRPSQPSFTSPNWQQQPGQFQSPNFQAPGFQSQPFNSQQFNSQQINPQGRAPVFQKPTFEDGVRTITVPPRGEIAGNSFGAASPGSFPRTATAPGPSTEPIGNPPSNQTQGNLMWRRPGTSF
jgi:hypothetical protein